METNEIKKLIEAFYNGEATRQEEEVLLQYFEGDDVAEDLLDEKEIFLAAFGAEQTGEEPVPPGLGLRLDNLIDNLDRQEKEAHKKQKKNVRLIAWVWASGIAACVAILISLGIHFNKGGIRTTDPIAQVYELNDDDRQKIKEAEQALMLLSSNYNKGIDQLNTASKSFDKTNEVLNKTFYKKKQ